MTKWDLIQIEKVEKAIEKHERKQHENDIDLYYRYQGKTIVKTKPWREAVREIKETSDKLYNSGINPDIEPLLFECSWYMEDPSEAVYTDDRGLPVNNLFRAVIHSATHDYGIEEKDIRTWLKELITKKR